MVQRNYDQSILIEENSIQQFCTLHVKSLMSKNHLEFKLSLLSKATLSSEATTTTTSNASVPLTLDVILCTQLSTPLVVVTLQSAQKAGRHNGFKYFLANNFFIQIFIYRNVCVQ